MTESVIDFPKDGLCPEIWEKGFDEIGTNEVWKLTNEAKTKILSVYQLVCPEAKILHIIGSITSNLYTEKGDIDLHFLNVDKKFTSQTEIDQYRKQLQLKYTQKVFIGQHPIEIYYQDNEFQDYMSIGCYDVLKQKWIVGPELQNPEFNPYSEYYDEITKKSEKVSQKVRNIIFSIYEIAVVLKKNAGTDLQIKLFEILKTRLNEVKKLYDQLRSMRKVYSSPTSKEEALKYRSSREWKIADATFKLFDKYGYLEIMRKLIALNDVLITSDVSEEAATSILDIIKKYINNADKLSEKELYEDEQLDEGPLQNISLAMLLAIPTIMPEKAIAAKMNELPTTELKANSKEFQDIVKDFSDVKIGKFALTNAINIIAWTLYGEANNQDKAGKEAVASTIFNRAGGDPIKMLDVILAPRQYSTWNSDNPWKLTVPTDDSDWNYRPPKKTATNRKELNSWTDCVEIATQMMLGKFKSTIGDRNSYLNKKVVAKINPKVLAPNGWGTQMKDQMKIGDHTFGYLANNDGFRNNRNQIDIKSGQSYIVKKGDSLWKIAKAYNMSAKNLAMKNGLDINKPLQIGQKLRI